MTELDSRTILEKANAALAQTGPVAAVKNNKEIFIMIFIILSLILGAYFAYKLFFDKGDTGSVIMGGTDFNKKRR